MCCSVSCDFLLSIVVFELNKWWDRKQYPMHDRTHQKRHDKLLGVPTESAAKWYVETSPLPCRVPWAKLEVSSSEKKHPTANPVKKKMFPLFRLFFIDLERTPIRASRSGSWLFWRCHMEKKNETHNATLAETIIATETLGSENKFPFGKTSRQCYVSFSECTSVGRGSREVFPPGFAFCSLPIAREPLSTKTIHSRWLNHPFQKNMISPIFTGKKTTTITL